VENVQASIIPTTAIQERFLTNLLICNTKIYRGIFGSSSKLHLTLVEKAQAGSGHSSLVPTNTFPIMFKSYFIPPSRKCVPFVTTINLSKFGLSLPLAPTKSFTTASGLPVSRYGLGGAARSTQPSSLASLYFDEIKRQEENVAPFYFYYNPHRYPGFMSGIKQVCSTQNREDILWLVEAPIVPVMVLISGFLSASNIAEGNTWILLCWNILYPMNWMMTVVHPQ
jgi:hypothetical protein